MSDNKNKTQNQNQEQENKPSAPQAVEQSREEKVEPTKEEVSKFMSSIPDESKVAVIIPLYGFWKDVEIDQLTAQVLQIALSRITSQKHQLYLLFVGEPERFSKDVDNIITGRQAAGNVTGVFVKEGTSYSTYLYEGLDHARESTDATFFIVFNPWIMIKEDGIDQLLERVNRSDVGMVSGYETNALIAAENFDEYNFGNTPKEERDLNINLMGMTRQFSEMLALDDKYKTHSFLARDFAQSMYQKGFEVITSQFVPIFSFDIDWTLLEEEADFESDKAHFLNKWRYDPSINYNRPKA